MCICAKFQNMAAEAVNFFQITQMICNLLLPVPKIDPFFIGQAFRGCQMNQLGGIKTFYLD